MMSTKGLSTKSVMDCIIFLIKGPFACPGEADLPEVLGSECQRHLRIFDFEKLDDLGSFSPVGQSTYTIVEKGFMGKALKISDRKRL